MDAAGGWLKAARLQGALVLAAVAIAVLPLAVRGPSCGQDFDFHLESWLDVARSWHQGVVYPRWDAAANYGAGEPRFVFYPPLSWVLGGALGTVLPWGWVPLAYTAMALLGAGLSLRAMAREWMGEEAATVAACLYVVNPYMMFVACERGALAELLAAAWIPLLVLYGLRREGSVVPLGVAVAGIWLTDAPAAVMGCYMLALLVGVAAIRDREWRLVERAAGGVGLGLGLAGFWLVPAIREQRWVQIGKAIGPLMRVEDSFLFGYVGPEGPTMQDRFNAIYHNGVLRAASWIGVALIAGVVLAAWRARQGGSRLWMPLVAVAVAIAGLQLRWSDWIWRVAPELKYIQFPWRWMLVLGMVAAGMAGLALRRGSARRREFALRMAVVLAFAGAMAVLAWAHFWQACDEEDNVAAQVRALSRQGFAGTDEYTLRGVEPGSMEEPDPDSEELPALVTVERAAVAGDEQEAAAMAARVEIAQWRSEEKLVTVTCAERGVAVLRLMSYPAWWVTRNGAAVRPVEREDGLMAIPVEAGANRIEVRWGTTGDQCAGIGLSLAALAVTLAVGGMERRRAGRRKAGVQVP